MAQAKSRIRIPKFKLQSKKWFPLRLGESVYRQEVGQSYIYPVPDGNTERIAALAHRYAAEFGISVETQPLKVIYEDGGADLLKTALLITPAGNPRAIEYQAEVESGELVRVPGGRSWYPTKLGELIYRAPASPDAVVMWMVPDTNSNYVMALGQSYANRLGMAVTTKLGKAVVVENGVEVVRRIILLFPSGNERAIEYAAKLAAEGLLDSTEGCMTPEAIETFIAPRKPPADALPRRRGRPPVIRTPEDRARWEAEFKRRDEEAGIKKD